MISILSALAYACPLILCSLGALFSEYTGCLALFLDGLVSFSAFLLFGSLRFLPFHPSIVNHASSWHWRAYPFPFLHPTVPNVCMYPM